MKVYKLTVMVIDFDELGTQQITDVIENTPYPNHCMSPEVKRAEAVDIGPWDDDHPLNNRDTADAEFWRLFQGERKKLESILETLDQTLDMAPTLQVNRAVVVALTRARNLLSEICQS